MIFVLSGPGFIGSNFVQINHRKSVRNLFRYLHCITQKTPCKIIQVLRGAFIDLTPDFHNYFQPHVGMRWLNYPQKTKDNFRPRKVLPMYHWGISNAFKLLYNTCELAFDRSILWSNSEKEIKWLDAILPTISGEDRCGCLLIDTENTQ